MMYHNDDTDTSIDEIDIDNIDDHNTLNTNL